MTKFLLVPVLLIAGCVAAPTVPPQTSTVLDAICGLRLVQQTETTTVLRVRCDRVAE